MGKFIALSIVGVVGCIFALCWYSLLTNEKTKNITDKAYKALEIKLDKIINKD